MGNGNVKGRARRAVPLREEKAKAKTPVPPGRTSATSVRFVDDDGPSATLEMPTSSDVRLIYNRHAGFHYPADIVG